MHNANIDYEGYDLTMFKIGDFSRLTRVSIKTLHHYDEIGLFKPVRVDPGTGYRYYSFDQLPRLNRILALRGLGFALDQIARMLADGPSPEELRGMLMLRRAQLQRQVAEDLEKLTQVEMRLNQIEQEGNMSEIEVLTKPVGEVRLIGARELVPEHPLMRERCMALNDAVCAAIRDFGLKTDGISFALYYSSDERGIDVEMAYAISPLSQRLALSAPVSVHTLPEVTVAYGVYRGSYDDFGSVGRTHWAITRWIEANGYRPNHACREYYLRPPQSADDRLGVMEIQYPITRG